MRWMKVLGWAGGVLASLLILWVVVGNAWAGKRERDARDRWEKDFGTLDELLKKYPKTERNDSALKVETMAPRLGLSLALAIPNIRNAFRRADRLVVDAELTSKILEAKALRRKNGGRWPKAIPGIEVSKFPGAFWRYEVSPEGRMSIAFSRELQSATLPKILPLRFESD